jgi:hydroxyethylthiazole kinase-like sugar kinase family protein
MERFIQVMQAYHAAAQQIAQATQEATQVLEQYQLNFLDALTQILARLPPLSPPTPSSLP